MRDIAVRMLVAVLTCAILAMAGMAGAWEPTKPIELVVPAGTGGGADQMARIIAPLVDKYKLSPRPLIVVNKPGGAGAEGFTYVKAKEGDAHTLVITLSNLFTTPLHTGVPFNWKDLSPIARLALDEFILWVNAETPYQTAKDYVDAVKAKPSTFKMGGTGTAQEDQLITVQLEQALGLKFIYVPFKGGGEVCVNMVGKHVDSTVNNPIECVSHWKAKRVRPLAVFDRERLAAKGWGDIPTVKEALGVSIEYLMLRGIFGTPKMPADAVSFYQGMLKKVTETAEFKQYMEDGALKSAWITGPEFVRWLEEAEALHRDLMQKGGLLKQ
jgi:putative tricarboxylic transport membrane protein